MRRRLMFTATILALAFAALAVAVPAAQAQKAEKFLVFFEAWSAQIEPGASDVVRAAASYAKEHPAMRVDIIGFAANDGSKSANLYLSLLRAQLVSDMLAATGIDPERISRVGEGAVNYVDSPQEGRRVEIVVRAP